MLTIKDICYAEQTDVVIYMVRHLPIQADFGETYKEHLANDRFPGGGNTEDDV